jgi:hypothetical protein
MGVKHQHPDYTNMLGKWQRCNDVCEGQDTIHLQGNKYLPQLTDQQTNDYIAYKDRTPFYNATWRTIVGLQGMLFRKPPEMTVPAELLPMMENVTLTGTPMHIFALEVVELCLKNGRVGIFVDYPIVDTTKTTRADAASQNLRPMLKLYTAKSIINWKTRTIKNATVLSMVVITENTNIPSDEFEDTIQVQYRVLDLMDMPADSNGVVKTVYRVRVFVIKNEEGEEIDVLLSTTFPRINDEMLDFIPFQFMGTDDVDPDVDEPPLIDLVDMNLAHYRVSADYEHGCHFTGLPTPIISGYTSQKEGEKFYIGSTTAWLLPRHDSKAFYLEFTGQGLTCLERNLANKEGQMAILGARMLEVQVRGVESANTAAIHRGGEQSMLASVAQAVSIGITKVLKVFSLFVGATGEVKYALNKDFFPVPMDALTLTALIAGWQNGAYSYKTMFENLQRGEVIDLESTVESEQAAIKANPAPIIDMPTTPGNAAPKAASTAAGGTGEAPTITQQQNAK